MGCLSLCDPAILHFDNNALDTLSEGTRAINYYYISYLSHGSNLIYLIKAGTSSVVQFHTMMYTEAQLISFGNYLFKRYNVQVFSNDGSNTPIYQRQVDNADCCNWEYEGGIQKQQLPSEFQKGDKVFFACMPEGIDACVFPSLPSEILAVHFYGDKVKYDLDLLFVDNQRSRIYNVDSALVMPRS